MNFDELFKEIVRRFRGNRGTREHAEDLAQEGSLAVFTHDVEPGREVQYAYMAALNRARKLFSRGVPEEALDPDLGDDRISAEAALIGAEENARFGADFAELFRALPPDTRRLFRLMSEGLSQEAAAKKLGMNPITARSKVMRARKKFKEKFGSVPDGVTLFDIPGEDE